jgi:hypothetical protein
MSDPILGKIVVDFSQKYISVYLCEGDGTVKDGDHFRWPYRLDVKDARQETRDCFDWFYDFCNDTVTRMLKHKTRKGRVCILVLTQVVQLRCKNICSL